MRTNVLTGALLLILLCTVTTSITSTPQEKTIYIPFQAGSSEVQYVPDEFIVVLKEEAGAPGPTNYTQAAKSGIDGLDVLAETFSVEYMRPLFRGAAERGHATLARFYRVKFNGPHDLRTVMAAYEADPAIASVEPDGIHPVYATPNDTRYSTQWHLNQAGDHDIDAPEAWNTETGDSAIIVAILDSGVRYYHKDLGGVNASYSDPGASRGNMWINWAEKNGTPGVDDDSNGYTDDWIGYDFVEGVTDCWPGEDCSDPDNDPQDFNGHGTHCAGIVAAINNNGYSCAAPAGGWGNGSLQEFGNGVKIMACRVGWSRDVGGTERPYVRMSLCAEAFYYASNNGAKIASCSWGSSDLGGLGVAVTHFINNGGLVFTAAGNDNNETASYLSGRTDVVSVAATDQNDCKADFSNYGTWLNWFG